MRAFATASVSWRTSLAILEREGAVIEPREGCLVVRTPDNPGYHWGNCLYVTTGDVDDAAGWLDVFAEEFPGAPHRAVALPRAPDRESWVRAGFGLETERILSSRVPIVPTPPPAGYTVGPVRGDAWDGVVAAGCADGPHTEDHRVFERRRVASERRLVEAGAAEWFAVLSLDGAVVSALGIVLVGELARYQSVLTLAAHRRRGLARHLLGVASGWAFDRGARELVIVADEGSDGDRLYRAAGFVPGAVEFSAYAPAWTPA
ncbi:MAG: GNAT family N-acetyltransferase [Actinomycetia bacterium]|nr:GNAT family N-acetyltransferase [Actinomycetes bacterium]